eukprot:scaffold1495_cov130-Isochrysis_galbana.AAC.3
MLQRWPDVRSGGYASLGVGGPYHRVINIVRALDKHGQSKALFGGPGTHSGPGGLLVGGEVPGRVDGCRERQHVARRHQEHWADQQKPRGDQSRQDARSARHTEHGGADLAGGAVGVSDHQAPRR